MYMYAPSAFLQIAWRMDMGLGRYEAKSRKYQGAFKVKSREKLRQVQ